VWWIGIVLEVSHGSAPSARIVYPLTMREPPGHCTSISLLRPAFFWSSTRRTWQEPFQHYRRADFSRAFKHHVKLPRSSSATLAALEIPKLLSCHPATLNYHTHAELGKVVAEVAAEVPEANAPSTAGFVDDLGALSGQTSFQGERTAKSESNAPSAQEGAGAAAGKQTSDSKVTRSARPPSVAMTKVQSGKTTRQRGTISAPAHTFVRGSEAVDTDDGGIVVRGSAVQRSPAPDAKQAAPTEIITRGQAGGLSEQAKKLSDQTLPVRSLRLTTVTAGTCRVNKGLGSPSSPVHASGAQAGEDAGAPRIEQQENLGSGVPAKRQRSDVKEPCGTYTTKKSRRGEPAVSPPVQHESANTSDHRHRAAGSNDVAHNDASAASGLQALQLPELDHAGLAGVLHDAQAKVLFAKKELEQHTIDVRRLRGQPNFPRLPRDTFPGESETALHDAKANARSATKEMAEDPFLATWAERAISRMQLLQRLLANIELAQEQLNAVPL
jgi:hypothetical protein